MLYVLALLIIVVTVILTLFVQVSLANAKKAAMYDEWAKFPYSFNVDWYSRR